jgi:hypothetical protein
MTDTIPISVYLLLYCLEDPISVAGCLRRGSATGRLLRLWVRIPQRAWMPVSCECCVLSGRGLSDGLIAGLKESCRMLCV